MLDNLYQNSVSTWEQELIARSFLYNLRLERKCFTPAFYGRYLNLLNVLETLPLTWAASICRSTLKLSDTEELPTVMPLLSKL